jgi:hypothetical protein
MASIAAQIAANSKADSELIFAVCHVSEMLDALKVCFSRRRLLTTRGLLPGET